MNLGICITERSIATLACVKPPAQGGRVCGDSWGRGEMRFSAEGALDPSSELGIWLSRDHHADRRDTPFPGPLAQGKDIMARMKAQTGWACRP